MLLSSIHWATALAGGGALSMFLCAGALVWQPDFQTDVNLVVLHVTVADHKGRFVEDLPQKAFHVYEDGVPQKISVFSHEDVPVAVGLVIDNSGSMTRKLPETIAAARAFAESSNPGDQMFVVDFNEHVWMGLPKGEKFTSSVPQLMAVLEQIRPDGKTALYDALAVALQHIRQSTLSKKVIVVVSDGGDNASRLRFAEALDMLKQSEAIVYTVGIYDEYDRDSNPGALRQFAQVSGGEAFFPQSIHDVTKVLQAVSRDIRSQYTVGYIPTNGRKDGTYRSVGLTVTAPHSGRWIVRTRKGYFAAPQGEPALSQTRGQQP